MALNADVPSSSFDMYLRAAAIIEQAKQQGITADAVRESLAVLGEQQYLTRHDYRGEPAYAHFAFTVQGFAHYGRKYLPNYATLVDRVAAHLVNAGDDESIVVARALGQSHMLIKQVLRWLGEQKLIKVEALGSPTSDAGIVLKMFEISGELKRAVRSGQGTPI